MALRLTVQTPHLQAAFPTILARCRSILQQYASDQRLNPDFADRERLEEVVCVLEVRSKLSACLFCTPKRS